MLMWREKLPACSVLKHCRVHWNEWKAWDGARCDQMTELDGPDATDPRAGLAAEAANFREVLSSGRSLVLLRLFDFLLERSNDERAPKEVEIALAVFDSDGTFPALQGSAVRVYVHRLRTKLDDHYAGKPGPRLRVLKGDYRLVLSQTSLAAGSEASSASQSVNGRWTRYRWPAALALILVLNVLVWWRLVPARPAQGVGVAETTFWRPFADIQTPTMVVAGDSYFFVESKNRTDITRLIFQRDIASRADLDLYFLKHPQDFYKYYDLNLHYVPSSAAVATWRILPLVSASHSGEEYEPTVISSSNLTAHALETANIIYVGRLPGLGILGRHLFHVSGFKADQAYDELIDRASGRHFSISTGGLGDQSPRTDYGYVASFPGPSGNQIRVVAGIGDLALVAMSKLVFNEQRLRLLEKQTHGADAFEALYKVRAMGGAVVASSLLIARPLSATRVWDVP